MNPNTVGQRQQVVMRLDMMNAEKKEQTKKYDRYYLAFFNVAFKKMLFFSVDMSFLLSCCRWFRGARVVQVTMEMKRMLRIVPTVIINAKRLSCFSLVLVPRITATTKRHMGRKS